MPDPMRLSKIMYKTCESKMAAKMTKMAANMVMRPDRIIYKNSNPVHFNKHKVTFVLSMHIFLTVVNKIMQYYAFSTFRAARKSNMAAKMAPEIANRCNGKYIKSAITFSILKIKVRFWCLGICF